MTQDEFARTVVAPAIRMLTRPGQVSELRALGVKRQYGRPVTMSGFFDDAEKMSVEALNLSGKATAVYVTLNPLTPALIARRCNRVDVANDNELAHDRDVLRRSLLLIDAD